MNLSGKVVILSGASRGLGLALAIKLVRSGAQVFGVSRTKVNWDKAKAHVNENSRYALSQADLTDEIQVKKFVNQVISKSKRIDILVNNAGVLDPLSRVEDISLSSFQRQMEGNLTSQFLVCKHTLPFFRKQKAGLIVNLSSMAGKRAVPKIFPYSASKFGVLALSQCIAKENDDVHLKCVTVCPGGINTEMRTRLFGPEDAQKQQSPDFVSDVIMQVIVEKIKVESGGDIVIRHGKITAINPGPPA
jgi:NAD(P)-dependent dehydrogenase (short-subunit alcohol dehydrogenase family)